MTGTFGNSIFLAYSVPRLNFFIFLTNLDSTNLAYRNRKLAYGMGLPIPVAPPNHLSTKTHPKRMYHAGEKLLKLNEINFCIKDTYVFILISI